MQTPKARHVRIHDLQPIAANQWSLWVADEEQSLPDFLPGQFCMLSIPSLMDPLLPRPYAVVEKKEGMYRFIFRVDGKWTKILIKQWRGVQLQLLGPLGKPAPRLSGKRVFIAGGVGYASLFSMIQDGDLLFYGLRSDLDRIPLPTRATEFFASDDGSCGFRGRIHELLLSEKPKWEDASSFYICGPDPMMKACFRVLPKASSYYFLEESMGCGVGICMGCVVPVPDSPFPKRSCIDGPVFRGDQLKEWLE